MKTLACFNKKSIIYVIICAIVVAGVTLGIIFGLKSKEKDSRIVVGAVVSNGIGCAEIGRTKLDDGGSAVDAAIATLVCEGVMLPQSMGLGGGFVAVIYTKETGKIETVVARETAPAAATEDMFVNMTKITGAISGAVPGELLGYWEMHQKYGRLPWKALFEPTIKLCREGHVISKYLGNAINSTADIIRKEPSMAEIFIKEDGTIYKEGEYMKRIKLADTLEKIANNGAGELYNGGETGKKFVEDIQKMGGIITEQDLQDYRVTWDNKDHITATVTGGYTLYSTPLPSSGAVLAFILNVVSDLYISNEAVYWQRVVETFKHAYGQRSNLGDLMNEPVVGDTINKTFNNLISEDFARNIRKLIFDNQTFQEYEHYGANFSVKEDHGTANMAVLASNGDAVTVTSTINNYFGAKVRSTRTGIILNDEMDDFSTPGVDNGFGIPPSRANFIKPGKRPMSSMCPAIIIDTKGNVRLLVGAAGGSKITTSVASAIIKYLIFNETMNQAVNDGRLHHQLAPMHVDIEPEVPNKIRNYLSRVGHKLNELKKGSGFAALTAIGNRDGKPQPFFDRRRVGSTAIVHIKNKMNH